MKTLNNYINEALIKKDTKIKTYNYYPKNRDELIKIIKEKIDNLPSDGLLDLTDIDISGVDDYIAYLFQHITKPLRDKIKKIDVSGWNTSKFTKLNSLFYICSNVEEIIGIENFNTENVESITSMFYKCANLKKVDLSKWNVKKITSFNYVFEDCFLLESVGNIEHRKNDLPVDISKNPNTYGYNMFKRCSRKLKRPSWSKYLRKK